MKLPRLAAAILLMAAAGCGDNGPETVEGVVIEVEGGITDLTGFLLQLPDGTRLRLQTPEGLTMHDGSPLGHLRDHMRSGSPIEVEYEVGADGIAVARSVRDG